MEVPREDMELIRDALALADNYATLTGASIRTLGKIRQAQVRVLWLLSEAPDPHDDLPPDSTQYGAGTSPAPSNTEG
jgi:hypothetical protein